IYVTSWFEYLLLGPAYSVSRILSLHDALPISGAGTSSSWARPSSSSCSRRCSTTRCSAGSTSGGPDPVAADGEGAAPAPAGNRPRAALSARGDLDRRQVLLPPAQHQPAPVQQVLPGGDGVLGGHLRVVHVGAALLHGAPGGRLAGHPTDLREQVHDRRRLGDPDVR